MLKLCLAEDKESVMKKELLLFLEEAILSTDKILFFSDKSSLLFNLLSGYSDDQLKKNSLFLLKKEAGKPSLQIECIQLDDERGFLLQHLYYTYEFSNKFSIFSVGNNFGTIWNYVKTGILTSEEALASLLD